MEEIKKDVIKYGLPAVAILLVGAALIAVTHRFFSEFDRTAFVLVNCGIGFALYGVVDNIFLKSFNTKEELRKGNVAYAVKLLGFAVIIAGCFIAA